MLELSLASYTLRANLELRLVCTSSWSTEFVCQVQSVGQEVDLEEQRDCSLGASRELHRANRTIFQAKMCSVRHLFEALQCSREAVQYSEQCSSPLALRSRNFTHFLSTF